MDPETLEKGREQINEWVWLESSTRKVEEWTRRGLMTRDAILERAYQKISNGFWSSEDLGFLRENFVSACSLHEGTGEECLPEVGFCSVLGSSLPSPEFHPLNQAGHVVYTSMTYLANVPFGPPPGESYLNFKGLVRALVWSSPARDSVFRGGAASSRRIHSRARTDVDNRRLLFQSFATAREGYKVPFSLKDSQKKSAERAFEFHKTQWDYSRTYAVINNDADGDEIYHDIIDVLYCTEPFRQEWLAAVTRDVYRPLAKELLSQDPLHFMIIPSRNWEELVALLLSLHFDQPSAGFCTDMSDLNTTAVCIAKAFTQGEGSDIGVTWEMFDFALTKVTV